MYEEPLIRGRPWKPSEANRYRRHMFERATPLRVTEDGVLWLGKVEHETIMTMAAAPCSEVRLTRTQLPTPRGSLIVDFGTSQWIVDFFWPQVHEASRDADGKLSRWRFWWNCNRGLNTTRGAHRRREAFITEMTALGASVVT